MKTSTLIHPNRFLAAAQSVDANTSIYACNALDDTSKHSDAEIALFHRLYADNGDDEYGYTDTTTGLHGSTFYGAHNFSKRSAKRHRVIALCFAHWVAQDIVAGKKPLG